MAEEGKLLCKIDERLNNIDEHIKKVDKHIKKIGKHVNNIDKHLNNIDKEVKKIESKIKLSKGKLDKYDLCHYTSIDNMKKFFIKSEESGKYRLAKIRLRNARYMNDPEEGTILLKYLSDKVKKQCEEECIIDNILNNLDSVSANSEDVYLFSLSRNKDKLHMWVHYAEKANGICLVIDDTSIPDDILNNKPIGFVSYINLEDRYIAKKNYGEEWKEKRKKVEDSIEQIAKYIGNLQKEIELSKYGCAEKRNIEIRLLNILNRIRFLFKSSDYKYEREVRLLQCNPTAEEIKYDESYIPLLHVEVENLKYKEVIIGPKVENPQHIALFINSVDRTITVEKSKIKYR